MTILLIFKKSVSERERERERKYKDIFVIRDWPERTRSQFSPTKFVVCCKAFVDFQIDLFVKKETFPLIKITCNYSLMDDDYKIDFDYNEFLHINCDSGSDDDCNTKQTNCFESSVCFSKKGYNLSFSRFCLRCKQVFLRYFTQKLQMVEKNYFF